MKTIPARRTESGLTVMARRVDYAPVAAVVVAYRVGSRDEVTGIRGVSHFIEHMMFKGTPEMPPSRYWQLIKRAGGVANAFTSRDMTAYYTVVPRRSLRQVLAIEADRMTNCSMDPEEIAAERQVVREELRMTGRDNPTGALMDSLYATAFSSHPYRWPVAGLAEDVEAFDRTSVLQHYSTYYRPSNATLAVCGNVDVGDVVDMAEELFTGSDHPAGERGGRGATVSPTSRIERDVSHPSTLRRLAMAWRIPPGDHPDTAVLKLLALRLSSGRTGLLESSLVQRGIAVSASASALGGVDPGLFIVSATLAPGVEHSTAVEAVESDIAGMSGDVLDCEEVAALSRRLRSDALFASSNPAGRSIQLAMDHCRFDDARRTEQLLERAGQASGEDLSAAASRYLDPSTAVLVRMEPAEGGGLFPSAEIPEEMPPSDVREPESIDLEELEVPDRLLEVPVRSISHGAQDGRLSCGARLIVIPDHSFPTAALSFCFPMASDAEPPELAGLSSVTAESMMRGTVERGYRELHALIEDSGGSMELGAGREFAHGMLTFLPTETDTALNTMAEVLLHPGMREDDVNRVVREKAAEISRKHESPFGLAADNLSLMMCAPPEMARIPTAETLEAIDFRRAREWHRRCCRPEGALFVAVGDLDGEGVRRRLDRLLEGWKSPKHPLPQRRTGTIPAASARRSRHMEGIEQAAVLMGMEVPDRFSDERQAMGLISWLLGGGIGSRLGHRVRDREGLAYAVGSAYLPWPDCGRLILYLSASGENAERALASSLEELRRLAEEPVGRRELRLACANMVGRQALERMDYGSVADYLLVHLARGRELDFDLQSLRSKLSLTPEDLLDTGRRWLGADRPLFVSRAGDVSAEDEA
mgnify:CR=1 FL=1